MSTASADRNLLFGVLAVQLDFVSRDDLIAATSRWVLDKGQPLSDVFVEQGMLSAEESQLIDNKSHQRFTILRLHEKGRLGRDSSRSEARQYYAGRLR